MRLTSLDGLRGLFATLVVVDHTAAFFSPNPRLHDFLGDVAALSVEMFFVLSGYVLTREWHHGREGRQGFLWRRVTRLLPAYVLISGVTMAVAAWHGELTRRAFWHEVTLTQFLGDLRGAAMPQAWTLGLEACFYVLLPLVLLQVVDRTREVQVSVLVGLSVGGLVVYQLVVLLVDPTGVGAAVVRASRVPQHLLFFLGGALLALLQRDLRFRPTAAIASVGLLVLLLGSLATWAPGTPTVVNLAVRDVAAVLLVWSAPPPGAVLAWLGKVSYSLYLWHWVVLRVLFHEVGQSGRTAVMLPVALGITALLAAATYRWLEVPAQRSLRRRFGPRAPAALQPA